ncbi:NlpC/P60 family protein [Bizionia gelidisalsuginis]|uniref:NlpC/P60 family protein n=2 Tax=Bizionia TaxID=283785 RepID=A0A8H2QKC4_9FLAO|nr:MULTISPECIES: C40 family peptidase [Bizionia]TYB78092.1 NlpC/P60 family protein [Bizionia saleffrena]TYC12130.1 NlpC/P60 family protein [Bizionia gelidisalsuginis]
MRKIILILCLLVSISACKSTNTGKVVTKKSRTTKTADRNPRAEKEINEVTEAIVKNAKRYKGTRYKYGGTTKRGMDCSGLIYTAFKEEDIAMPRTTGTLSTHGNWVDLKKVQEGDLLFFATSKNSRTVNHVGIVTTSRLGKVEFIHSSSSRGVMISDLAEKYWYFAFVQARRVL